MPKRSRKPRSRSEDGRAAWRRRNSLTGRTPLFPQPLQGIDGVLQLKHLVFKVGDDRVVLGWCRAHGSRSFRSGCAINVIGHSTQGRCSDPAAGRPGCNPRGYEFPRGPASPSCGAGKALTEGRVVSSYGHPLPLIASGGIGHHRAAVSFIPCRACTGSREQRITGDPDPDTSGHARDGGRRQRSRLVNRGNRRAARNSLGFKLTHYRISR